MRCAEECLLRQESPTATAPVTSAWVAIEQPGPWQADALKPGNSRMPEKISKAIGGWTDVKVVFIRSRHRHKAKTRRLFVANVMPDKRWLMSAELIKIEQVLDLDAAAIAEGIKPGWLQERITPVTLVCTNGKRDICCALAGRKLINDLESRGEAAWESTHFGGHRFAPNRLTLPDGRMYSGFDDSKYRGASGFTRIQQAAECKIRAAHGFDDLTCSEPEEVSSDQWVVQVMREDFLEEVKVYRRKRGLAVESCGKEPVDGYEYFAV